MQRESHCTKAAYLPAFFLFLPLQLLDFICKHTSRSIKAEHTACYHAEMRRIYSFIRGLWLFWRSPPRGGVSP